MGLESPGNSNIGVLSDCVFAFMAYLNPRLFVRILARNAIFMPKAEIAIAGDLESTFIGVKG
jgi:hypothetical protein